MFLFFQPKQDNTEISKLLICHAHILPIIVIFARTNDMCFSFYKNEYFTLFSYNFQQKRIRWVYNVVVVIVVKWLVVGKCENNT